MNVIALFLVAKVMRVNTFPTLEMKNLGITLDNGLRFSEHVSNVLCKSYAKFKLVYANRDYPNSLDVKVLLCNPLISLYTSYCDVVYGPRLTCVKLHKSRFGLAEHEEP